MNKNVFIGGVLAALFLLLVSTVLADAPTRTAESFTEKWDNTLPWRIDLDTYFSDPEGGELTYSFVKADATTDITASVTDGVVTLTVDDDDWTGENRFTATATDNESLTAEAEFIVRKDVPSYCDVSDDHDIKIGDIEFDDDDYKIREKVSVTVEDVEADGEDLENVEVEVCLFNTDSGEEIDCWESDDSYDIDDDDKEDFDVEFTIPNSEDIGKKDNYFLVVRAQGEDSNGDNHCVQDSEDITIERDDHDVIVTSFSLIPNSVDAGESVQATVKVENIGTKDEDDVYVVLRDSILGIDLESNRFDLDKYSKSDNDHTFRFVFTVPEDTKAGDYVLEPVVYFDDGDENSAGEFETLTVKLSADGSNGGSTPGEVQLGLTTDTQITASDEFANLHFVITNSGSESLTATISVAPVGTWARSILDQPLSLAAGQNNVYMPLTLEDVKAGMNSATVTIKPAGTSDFAEKQFTLNFEVQEGTSDENGIFGGIFEGRSTTFWVIVDVVLIVLALLFIRAVFGSKKSAY